MIAIRPMFLCLVLNTLLFADGRAAEQSTFTLDQVMSAPFPAHLAAAPTGGTVAWVFNERGVRNLWVAEPPGYRGRKLST
jgi:hypothetical protein